MKKTILLLAVGILVILISGANVEIDPPVEPCKIGDIGMVKCQVRFVLDDYLRDGDIDIEEGILARVNGVDFVSVGLDKKRVYVVLRQGKRLYNITYKEDDWTYKCTSLTVSDKSGL